MKRLICRYIIGGSSEIVLDRRVSTHWKIKDLGWRGFIQNHVQKAIKWVDRIWLQNPFGSLSTEAMQWDQYLHAIESKTFWLVQDFIPAWSDFIKANPQVEVSVYLGSLNPSQNPNLNQPWLTDVVARIIRSVQPIIDAKIRSVGIDASAGSGYGTLPDTVGSLLRQQGIKVYAEAWPQTHTRWINFCINERFYQTLTAGAWNPLLKARQDLGECVRLLEDASLEKAQKILREGDTAALGADWLMTLKPEQLGVL